VRARPRRGLEDGAASAFLLADRPKVRRLSRRAAAGADAPRKRSPRAGLRRQPYHERNLQARPTWERRRHHVDRAEYPRLTHRVIHYVTATCSAAARRRRCISWRRMSGTLEPVLLHHPDPGMARLADGRGRLAFVDLAARGRPARRRLLHLWRAIRAERRRSSTPPQLPSPAGPRARGPGGARPRILGTAHLYTEPATTGAPAHAPSFRRHHRRLGGRRSRYAEALGTGPGSSPSCTTGSTFARSFGRLIPRSARAGPRTPGLHRVHAGPPP